MLFDNAKKAVDWEIAMSAIDNAVEMARKAGEKVKQIVASKPYGFTPDRTEQETWWIRAVALSLACYTGIRPGEITRTRWCDLFDEEGEMRQKVSVLEPKKFKSLKKRKPRREIKSNPRLVAILEEAYDSIPDYKHESYIFITRRGVRDNHQKTGKVMGNTGLSFHIRAAYKAVGYDQPVSTYCMRKAYARRMYEKLRESGMGDTAAMHHLMKDMNHSNIQTTMCYLPMEDRISNAHKSL